MSDVCDDPSPEIPEGYVDLATYEEARQNWEILLHENAMLRRKLETERTKHTHEMHVLRTAWTETLCERQKAIMDLRMQVADLEHALNTNTPME